MAGLSHCTAREARRKRSVRGLSPDALVGDEDGGAFALHCARGAAETERALQKTIAKRSLIDLCHEPNERKDKWHEKRGWAAFSRRRAGDGRCASV